MDPSRRKPIRLPESIYATQGIVFSITIGTSPRMPIFEDTRLGLACVERLRYLRVASGILVYAYCLMPDHVHLLIGASDRVSVTTFVQRWKSLCYQEWRRHGGAPRSPWQRSFWDHGLRMEESLLSTARYIVHNPVRAGLVGQFHEYPLCGSMEWQL